MISKTPPYTSFLGWPLLAAIGFRENGARICHHECSQGSCQISRQLQLQMKNGKFDDVLEDDVISCFMMVQ